MNLWCSSAVNYFSFYGKEQNCSLQYQSTKMTKDPNNKIDTVFKHVTHVIFDMDGLLLDSEECYHKIDLQVIGKYGKPVPNDLKLQLLGYSDIDCAKKIVEICNLPCTPEEYEQDVRNYAYLLKEVKLLPGAEKLIRHFASQNIPIAIATSSSYDSVQAKLQNHKSLFDLFHHIVMASSDPDVKFGKPAPDVFLVCANRFPNKPNPNMCLVFEDAPSGVIAARKAGMQVVLVPDERLTSEEKENATLVLDSLLDFKPENFGLPPFN